MKIEEVVREEIRNLKPYEVKDFPVRIKLDANESTYSLPEEFQERLLCEIKGIAFNRYPDPHAVKLKEIISKDLEIEMDQLIIGNGSDELIQSIMIAFGESKAKVLFPVPTFAMYEILSLALGKIPVKVPLNDKWDLDLDTIKKYLKEEHPRTTFLSFPNNPTGNCFSIDKVLEVIDLSDGIVVLDEAYYDFSQKTFIRYLKDFKNLIILRSLSKIGLAGLRVGIMIASRELVEQLIKVKLPYNVNIISQAISGFVLRHKEIINSQIQLILKEREKLFVSMENLEGIIPYPTDSNFILFKEKRNANYIWRSLLEHGILIKNLNNIELLENCLRVTIGQERENSEFLKVLKRSLKT
ncbi:MAG TPA: histidinol-phosphate transaminase [Nitrospinota bacterium]|nr:histidinol-phosphate transaminase [Nitrospinota bacterium]